MPRSRSPLLRSARRGLTLVEILIVIAVLGVLMTVLGVGFLSQLDEANVDATKLQIRRVEQGLAMYAAKHKGKFPSTSDGLEAAVKYFPDNRVPTDAWGNELQYYSPGTNTDNPYEIVSLGKDGVEGGDDVNADIYSYSLLGDDEE